MQLILLTCDQSVSEMVLLQFLLSMLNFLIELAHDDIISKDLPPRTISVLNIRSAINR